MKIAVLLSGGIDSSFAALYLKRKGEDIIGISFSQLEETQQELQRAQEVAKELSIPYYHFNVSEVFNQKIIKPFYETYLEARTPNPCPFCNKIIKFTLLWKKARELGMDKISTGHYAKIEYSNQKEEFVLKKAEDKNKDQSYFLWQLNQKQLSKAILPLGGFTKEQVREEINNSNLGKLFGKEGSVPESHDVCFIQEENLSEFLKQHTSLNIGPIFNQQGEKIGEHPGIQFFTKGQRKGLGLGAKTPQQQPLYIKEIDKAKNAIVVAPKKELYQQKITIENVNWISQKPPETPLEVEAKIRYRSSSSPATIKKSGSEKYKLEFKEPQYAPTPGQHAVFYQKNLLLGGGIIQE